MVELSQELQAEIRRRAASGDYASAEDLVRYALKALDEQDRLETLLLEGLDSGFAPLTDQDFDDIRREGLEEIRRRRTG